MFSRLRRKVGHFSFGKALLRKRRWLGGERLRRPAMLARYLRARHWPLFDGEQWFAGFAIEQKEISDLGNLRDGVDSLAAVLDRDQVRRRRDVVVPDIVMHHLEVPDALASVGFERKDAISK